MSSGEPVTPRNAQTTAASVGTPRHEGPPASYTSDEQSFHKLFPQVPLNEKLVENYQCGLSRSKIVRVGRLYLTSLRLCFHSTFMKESVMIEWENIVDVEKKENFVFEAVIVKTNTGESHYFSAFVYGNTDQAHKMITMLWSVRKRYAGMQLNTAASAPLPPVAPQTHPTVPVTLHRHPRTESTSSLGSVGFEVLKAYNAANAAEGPLSADDSTNQPPATAPSPPFVAAEVPRDEDTRLDQTEVAEESTLLPLTRDDTALPPLSNNSHASSADHSHPEETQQHKTSSLAPPSPQSQASTPSNLSLTTATPTIVVQDAVKPHSKESGLVVSVLPDVSPRVAASSPTQSLPPPTPLGAPLTAAAHGSASVTPSRGKHSGPDIASPMLAASNDQLDAETLALMQQDKQQQQLIRSQSPPVQSKAERRAEKAIARASAATIATIANDTPHEVLRHFPNVPKTERVVDSFQCSYVMGVHRIGKLYITSHYVLFNSMMYVDGVCIRITDVAAIEKEQTIVILDGILFKMKNGQSHSFTSFVNRDAAFNILHHFFAAHKQMALDEPAPSTSPTAVPVSAEGLVPPPSLLEDAKTAADSGGESSNANNRHGKHKKGKHQDKDEGSPAPKKKGSDKKKKQRGGGGASNSESPTHGTFSSHVAQPSYDQIPVFSSVDDYSKIVTDFGTSLSPYEAFQRQIIPDVTLPSGFSIFDVFRIIFDDGAKLLEEYHATRQDTEQKWEAWRPATSAHSTHHHRTFAGQRTFTCTTIIKAVMAKACAFTEYHRFGFFMLNGSPHLVVQLSGQAIGVMFSDAFRAETLLVFSQPNAQTPQVTMRTQGHIQFLRSVWVKGKIIDTALGTEMPESYRTMTTMIHRAFAAASPMTLMSAAESAAAEGDASASESSDEENEALVATRQPSTSLAAALVDQAIIAAAPVTAPVPVPIPVAAAEAIPEPLKIVHAAITGFIILFAVRGLWTSMLWFDSYAGNYDIMYLPPGASQLPAGATVDAGALAAAVMARVGSQILHLLRPLVVIGLLFALRSGLMTLGRFILSAL